MQNCIACGNAAYAPKIPYSKDLNFCKKKGVLGI